MKAAARRRRIEQLVRVADCGACGRPFEPAHSASRYCSDACAVVGAKAARMARPLRVMAQCRRCGDALDVCPKCAAELDRALGL